jgi:hypothetical protein
MTGALFSEDHMAQHPVFKVNSKLDLTRVQEEAEIPDSHDTTIIASQSAHRQSRQSGSKHPLLGRLVKLVGSLASQVSNKAVLVGGLFLLPLYLTRRLRGASGFPSGLCLLKILVVYASRLFEMARHLRLSQLLV